MYHIGKKKKESLGRARVTIVSERRELNNL